MVRLPASDISPWWALSRRLLFALSLLGVMVALVWFDRFGYRDAANNDGVDFIDSLYYATVTLTTTGYGDITPFTPQARLVNAFVVTPLRVMFLVVLIGTTLEVLATQGREMLRVARWRRHMQDHIVVVGYGTKGRAAVATLMNNGIEKEKILVVDPYQSAIDAAHDDGLTAVAGDGTGRGVLRRAEVAKARQVIITIDRDDAAVLATLTVRQLNSEAYVVVAVREQHNVPLVRQSGADSVITSSEAVGRLLGLSAVSPSLGEVMEDLLAFGHGLEVAERPLLPREAGKQPQRLLDQVVAVVRNERVYRYYDPTVTLLEPGDRLVVIRPAAETPWAPRPGTAAGDTP
ncbi:MAG: potassium channel family protein [Nocardioidaceae bacterium]